MDEREKLESILPGRINSATRNAIRRIINEITTIKEADGRINPGYLIENYRKLYWRINNQSGGWKRMVSLAGFDPEEEKGGSDQGKK